MTTEVAPLLTQFRKLLTENNLDAYVIPRTDPHNSEILPACDERVKFISSFSGSNGIALISQNEALCWTDSRYYLQAPQELQKGWSMMKMQKGEIQWPEWVTKNVKEGGRVGVNPFLLSAESFLRHKKNFAAKKIELVILEDLVEKVWTDRPSKPTTPIFVLDLKYSGKSAEDKIKEIGAKLQENKADTYLITNLEEIAWTLNLRGADSDSTPYFISYLTLSYNSDLTSKGSLYILREKVPAEVEEHLKKLNITIKDYDQVLKDVATLEGTVYLDNSAANSALYDALKNKDTVVTTKPNIIDKLKAIKNATEIKGFADCHIRDGIAIVQYFAWVEHALNVEKRTDLNEYNASLKLNELRYSKELNKGLSFPAISSIGANGAIVHYNPKQDSAAALNNTEIYLLDSGGQYLDGTTDTTRTTHFGTNATAEEKDAYTRVLLGNLDVERALIPNDGTYGGADVDILARRHLFAVGLNFAHGTGHGVGHFLNVHEGPHGISKYRGNVAFEEGMIVTNEPGYYKEGGFGIRIENILVVVKKREGFLGFDNVTLVPYERRLIDINLLSKKDIEFIDAYHQRIYDTLGPILEKENDTLTLNYLKEKTAKLQA